MLSHAEIYLDFEWKLSHAGMVKKKEATVTFSYHYSAAIAVYTTDLESGLQAEEIYLDFDFRSYCSTNKLFQQHVIISVLNIKSQSSSSLS